MSARGSSGKVASRSGSFALARNKMIELHDSRREQRMMSLLDLEAVDHQAQEHSKEDMIRGYMLIGVNDVTILSTFKQKEVFFAFLANAIEKETKKGWLIILPEEKFDKIPNLVLSPMGIAESMGITASGNFEEKLRVTHNLPFTGAFSGESRVTKEQLEPCMFGHALLRIILHSSYKIWIRTEDMKSA